MTTPTALEILQALLRFDTTNPPGNEAACIDYIAALLADGGIPSTWFALDDTRPNLIARFAGRGEAPPLLLYGHVDVVTTEDQSWTHPPFAAEIHDGYLWGRGTLDMKGGVAMLLSAFLQTAAADTPPPGDLILCVLADEEAFGGNGVEFMVEQHPEQFAGVRHALGEFGGFTLSLCGQSFYPIMVAEKQVCWMTATFQGPGGHGSMPVRGGAMSKLARFLKVIDEKPLPVHISKPARLMFEALAAELSFPQNVALQALLSPVLTDTVLTMLGEQGRLFNTLLHNTVSPTILHGCSKVNVIPSEVSVELDGRLLPGQSSDDMLRELGALAGPEADLAVIEYNPCPVDLDMSYFDTLSAILKETDPTGKPIPMLLPGVTDGRFFARLGIQTYGFTPMRLPADFNFSTTIHAADERIPIDAPEFGANAIYQAVQRYQVQ